MVIMMSGATVSDLTLTLRIFMDGRECIALPYRADQSDEMAALLKEFWPQLEHDCGRLAVVVDDGEVLHLIRQRPPTWSAR